MKANKPLVGTAMAAALAGLIAFEDMRTNAYLDSVGVPTICAGSTVGVKLGDTKTKEQCWEMAEEEYREYEAHVLKIVKVPISEPTQIALTYFCYNVGKAGCAGSTAVRKINARDLLGGCSALRMWNKGTVNGKKVVIKGLDNRRKAEERLCLTAQPLSASWSWLPSVLRF